MRIKLRRNITNRNETRRNGKKRGENRGRQCAEKATLGECDDYPVSKHYSVKTMKLSNSIERRAFTNILFLLSSVRCVCVFSPSLPLPPKQATDSSRVDKQHSVLDRLRDELMTLLMGMRLGFFVLLPNLL